jgi:predicted CXXCH cytochrome family protein
MRALSAIVFAFFLAGVALSVDAAAESVPAIKKNCSICHITQPYGTKVLLKEPLSELCISCHPDRVFPGDHAVDMMPSMPVEGLPLDRDGRMTCVTCHDPHGMTGIIKLLRDSPRTLCTRCHNK